MPNHVHNVLVFENNDKTAKMLEGVRTEDSTFDFEKLIPKPDNVYRGDIGKYDDEDFGNNTWYEWATTNWGTKWNAYSISVDEDPDKIIIKFDTAWSPPYPIITTLSNRYKLPFTHYFVIECTEGYGKHSWDENGVRKVIAHMGRNENQEEVEDIYSTVFGMSREDLLCDDDYEDESEDDKS